MPKHSTHDQLECAGRRDTNLVATTHKVDPICIGCNYPLSQLDPATRVCPECGRAFDPSDPWSMNTTRPIPDYLRRWIGAANWMYPATLLAVIVTFICNVPLAGAISLSWVLLGVLGVLIGGVYYVRRLVRRAIVARYVLDRNLLNSKVTVDFHGASFDTWLGQMEYRESNDDTVTWHFEYGNDPFQLLPW